MTKKFLLVIVLISTITYSQDYTKGKQLFNTHCAIKWTRSWLDSFLQDVVELQGKDWTKTWIKNSKHLSILVMNIVEIWEEYNTTLQDNFLPDTELDDIVEYLVFL